MLNRNNWRKEMKTVVLCLVTLGLMATIVLAGESITYEVGGTSFEGYLEKGAANGPMVFLIHDWDGLTDYEIKRAGILKELGYSVFCADLYGKGVRPTEIADRKKCMTILTGDRPKMREYMLGALKTAKEQGLNTDNCVAMGYCFGGTAVLELARSGENLKGFATFHGGLGLPEGQDYSNVSGEYLIMHSITDGMEPFADLANGLEEAGVAAQLISYTGAPHGWTVFGGRAYREKPDQQSWALFTHFLNDILN